MSDEPEGYWSYMRTRGGGSGTGFAGMPGNWSELAGTLDHERAERGRAESEAAARAASEGQNTPSVGAYHIGSGHYSDNTRPIFAAVLVAVLIAIPITILAVSLHVHDQQVSSKTHQLAASKTHKAKVVAKKRAPIQITPVLTEDYTYKNAFGECHLHAGTTIVVDAVTDRGITYISVPSANTQCPEGVLNQYESAPVPSDVIGNARPKLKTSGT